MSIRLGGVVSACSVFARPGISAFFVLFGFLVSIVSGPAWAQQAQTPPQSGAAAQVASQPQPKVYAQIYGDWVYRCISAPRPGQAGQPARLGCQVVQQMVLDQNGKRVPLMTLAFVTGPNGAHAMNIETPLGVLLQPGIALSVDAHKPVQAAYSFCTAAGCWSLDQPAHDLLGQLRGGEGHARIVLLGGRNVTINFSLKGAVQGLAALDSGILPAQAIAGAGSMDRPRANPAF